jgi:hypothetical protein
MIHAHVEVEKKIKNAVGNNEGVQVSRGTVLMVPVRQKGPREPSPRFFI